MGERDRMLRLRPFIWLHGGERRSRGALFLLRFLSGAAIALLGACSGGHEPGTLGGESFSPRPEGNTDAGRATGCDPWSVRECGVELGTRDGVVNCARGVLVCEAGRWGSCLVDAARGTTSFKAPAPAAGTKAIDSLRQTLSVGGSSTTCTNNPCNPYCQVFQDVPDAAIKADGFSVTLDASPGPSLDNSNVPTGIGNKGNDPNGVCTPGCTTAACMQACQFDMMCSPTTAGKCTPFAVGQSGSCVGVDITAPTTCSVASGRNVTVCNRGTLAAPAGIKCYLFSGNSQHMPEATPDIGSATLIMTTQTAIPPGYCETQTLNNGQFDSNGTEELICNPNGIVLTSMSSSGFPTTDQLVPAYAGWTTPDNAYASDTQYATAIPVSAAGTQSAGPLFPSTNAAVSTTETWTSPANAYADDGLGMTAAPTTTATSYVSTKFPTADDGALGSNAYANDGKVGSVSFGKNQTKTIKFSGFGITSADVPSGATIASVSASVVWKVGAATDPLTTSVRMFDGATGIGTAASATYNGSNAPTSATALTQTVNSGVTPAMLTNASGFQVEVIFDNLSSGQGVTILASIDDVQVDVHWSDGTTSAATALGGFHFDSIIPSDATITSLTTEVKWNVVAAASNATLSFQAYHGGGLAAIAGVTSAVTNPPTTPTVSTVTVTNPGLVGSDLADANFRVRVLATRNSGASFAAAVDYVKVSALYTTPQVTNAVLYGGFGFNLPANATITNLTTEVKWFINTPVASALLGVQPYVGGGSTPVGTELTVTPAPTTATVSTLVQANPGLVPADMSDTNFKVRVRVTR
jgi:hypothetical protein